MSEQQQEYGGIIINGIDCSGGGGSSVTPNPPAPATETLSSLDINGVVYGVEQETRENIFSIFDTFNKNQKYADDSSFTPDESFFFKIEDDDSSWSSTATIYNNNAYDLTDIDKLELVVEITQQTNYAYLWVTFSQTKYTWNSTTWPGLYDNVDSALQITQSGSYEIDVSNLTGSYYIYIGATTGKDSTTHGGGCDNTHNGHITGTVTEFNIISSSSGTKIVPNPSGSATDTLEKLQIENTIYDFDAGTEVIANPTGTATDTLNVISIDGTIYEIEGGGSGGGSSAFIDTTNKLQTIQVTSGDDWSYVATQDCWATINPWNSSNSTPSQIYLDNVELVAVYNSRPQYAIYIKQGQTLLIKARTDYTYGSIYGLLQDGGEGSIVLKEGEYANFTNAGYIALPFTLNSDYILEVDYEATVNRNNNSVIGMSDGNTDKIHLTQWNNQWAHGTGTGETFYSDAQGMTSRHTYQCNYNGHNYLDNTEMSTYTPSSASTVYYHIGSRGTGNLYTGKIYSYKLTSISTGDVITHLKPMKLMAGKVILKEGLYDLVSGKFYSCNGMTIVGEGGGSTVIGTYIEPNSEEEPTETLENIKIDDTVYSVGGGGSDVEANPSDPATDTLNTIGIDGTVYDIAGGGGGGSSSGVYIEETLYTAPSNSFVDITVDWGWKDYDLYIFRVHDTYSENGDTTILTKGQISSMVSSGNHQYFFRFGSSNCSYVFTSSQLTARANANGLFIEQIIGIKVSGDYYSPVIYSTEEREIGVWTDNKPLYQKTFNGSWTLSGSSWSNTIVTIANAELKDVRCLDTDWQSMGVNGNIDSSGNLTLYNLRGTTLTARAVTVWYTKTTDTAGSGSYNTLGVPTVHYTTDEQVIGTWFDGRPIYQKVWDNLNINVTANNWTNTITITDGIDVVDCKAWGAFGNDYFLIVPTQAHIQSDNEGLLEIWAPSNRTVLRMMVQYTKTTD